MLSVLFILRVVNFSICIVQIDLTIDINDRRKTKCLWLRRCWQIYLLIVLVTTTLLPLYCFLLLSLGCCSSIPIDIVLCIWFTINMISTCVKRLIVMTVIYFISKVIFFLYLLYYFAIYNFIVDAALWNCCSCGFILCFLITVGSIGSNNINNITYSIVYTIGIAIGTTSFINNNNDITMYTNTILLSTLYQYHVLRSLR